MKKLQYSINIKPTQEVIEGIKKKLDSYFKGKNRDQYDSIIMTSNELLENAIKYGCSTPDLGTIEYNLRIDNDVVEIICRNSINNEAHNKRLKLHIDKINNSDNPIDLYVERLQELMKNPQHEATMLGLYRIAYEGEFDLSYTYDVLKKIITITAKKMT